jgi:hypothetical protein
MKVEFEDNNLLPKHVPGMFPEITKKSKSRMVNWLVDNGYFKSQKAASLFLLIIAVIFLVTSIYVALNGFSLPQISQPISDPIEYLP